MWSLRLSRAPARTQTQDRPNRRSVREADPGCYPILGAASALVAGAPGALPPLARQENLAVLASVNPTHSAGLDQANPGRRAMGGSAQVCSVFVGAGSTPARRSPPREGSGGGKPNGVRPLACGHLGRRISAARPADFELHRSLWRPRFGAPVDLARTMGTWGRERRPGGRGLPLLLPLPRSGRGPRLPVVFLGQWLSEVTHRALIPSSSPSGRFWITSHHDDWGPEPELVVDRIP